MREGNRVIGHTVSSESEWDTEQVDLILAYKSYVEGLDQNGFPFEESTSPEANPNVAGGYRYVADAPRTNWAAKAELDALDSYRKAVGEDGNMNGVFIPVRRVEQDEFTVDPYSFEGR